MKLKLTLFLLFISLGLHSQTDSATIRFIFPDMDMAIINELNDIQYIKLSCSDKEMQGKKFLLAFDEYKDGVIIGKDTSNLDCTIQKIPIMMGGDTVIYMVDPCGHRMYHPEDSIFEIRLAGKLQADTFKLIVSYPGIQSTKKFSGDSRYSLRTVSCLSDNRVKVPLNGLTPVLVYTPPFDTGSGGLESYCLLGTEEVSKWYEKFNVKHYYVISLRIE